MNALANKIYEQAIELPIEERLALVDKLLTSTNLSTSEEIDKAWAIEVEHRANEIKNGKAKLVPGEEVLNKIKQRFS